VFVALAATPLGAAVPVIGAPVFGIVLGLVLAAVVKPADDTRPGLQFASRGVLQTSIVLFGATLSVREVAQVGLSSLPVMLGTLAVALAGAAALGPLLGVRGDTQLLIGIGTGICGASAIAAATSVLKPKQSHVAYAVGTIFAYNVAAVLLFPVLGHLWGLSPRAFGLWAGTAINDTSSVVAAAYSFSPDAGPYAVVVKLCRSMMLVPIVIGLALVRARRAAHEAPADDAGLPWRRLVPLFLVGFLLAAGLNSLGVVPAAWHDSLTRTGTFLITTALAAIGLSLRIADIRAAGLRPLLLGGLLWVLVAASSLGLQALTHTL
jgi:uncharacterized integral membrane protein (TIGR00698 family)